MTEPRANSEGLLPSLLWRIDEAEQAAKIVAVPIQHYKADVLRNLRWIMNSSCRVRDDEIYGFDEAQDSTLNFGIPPTSGTIGSDIEIEVFLDRLKSALIRFETRILPYSLEVKAVNDIDLDENGCIGLQISGEIWCEPLPERFSLETFIDGDSGEWLFK